METGRTSFVLKVGLWMSLDVSGDGVLRSRRITSLLYVRWFVVGFAA